MEDSLQEFKKRLKSLSIDLTNLEKFLKESGINTPYDNIALDQDEKIWIPFGYIRDKQYFIGKYKLNEIIDNAIVRDNIAYSLQASDLFNFFMNRFRIGLSAGKVFYKYAIINEVSIIEAILYGAIDKLHMHCINDGSICNKNSRCAFYIKSSKQYNFSEIIKLHREKELLELTDEQVCVLMFIKGLRDNVHIWDNEERDYFNDDYCQDRYNLIVIILKYIGAKFPVRFENYQKLQTENCTRKG
jgi:hypothetical protein